MNLKADLVMCVATLLCVRTGLAQSQEPPGPRHPLGPEVPLRSPERDALKQGVRVTVATSDGIQSACKQARAQAATTVLLPAGEYVLETEVRVPKGITLAGEGPKTVCRVKRAGSHLFLADGDGVRFTRLSLRGHDPTPSTANDSYGINVSGGHNVRIDHCELTGFSYAVNLSNEATVQIDHCRIHHNLRDGLGYGVAVYSGAYVLVTDNEFSQNRHSLASNGALDWSSPKRLGKYVHKEGVRKTHWQFVHNLVGGNDLSPNELCAVDTHPGMDGSFIVEDNVFDGVRHGIGIRDGCGLIRRNVFRNLRTKTTFRPLVAISIGYGTHNNIPVEGCMPRNIRVEENRFQVKDGIAYKPCVVDKAENITVDGKLMQARADGPAASPLLRLSEMANDGVLRWHKEDQ